MKFNHVKLMYQSKRRGDGVMWKNKLFKNILAFCMALAVVYMVVICAIWIGYEHSKEKTAVINRSEQLMSGIKEDIDRRLRVAASVIEQFALDTEIRDYLKSQEFNGADILQVRNKLSNMGSSFAQLGFRIEVLNTNQQYIVTGEKALPLKEYLRENGMDSGVFEAVFSQLQNSGSFSRFVLYPASAVSTQSGQEQLVLLYKSYVNGENDMYFLASFDKNYLLSNYSLTQSGGG